MFASIKRRLQRETCDSGRFDLDTGKVASFMCRACRKVELTEDDWLMCPACAPRCSQYLERMLGFARKEAKKQLAYDAKRAIEQLPRWHWKTPASELRKCANVVLLPVIDSYVFGSKSLGIFGPSGSGKTTALAANVKLSAERATSENVDVELDDNYCLNGLKWMKAHDLVRARKEHRLGAGEDARPIIDAKNARVLIIDELGFEPASEIPFEIIDHRYENGRTTIVTSGLTLERFSARYGDAAFRRLTQAGLGGALSAFPEKP